jgi:hypothetical protein
VGNRESLVREREDCPGNAAPKASAAGESMKSALESPRKVETHHIPAEAWKEDRRSVLNELEKILSSRHFRSADRCKQFLRYVVLCKLDGRAERLKERAIGTDVFQRPPGYATGDDPVVRVQAGEVRRRLEKYYYELPEPPSLRIELPVGSYSPVFHREPASVPQESEISLAPAPAARVSRWKSHFKTAMMLGIGITAALAAGYLYSSLHRATAPRTILEQFWSPVFATRQPILICVAKPVAYRPTEEVYRRYSRTHPGTFQTEAERSNSPLPLDPSEKLTWGDFFAYTDYGVAGGDVYAAVALSGLLGRLDKPSQLRIGSGYTYEDLRDSPAAVIGGFNNKWTMQLVSNLHFAFIEDRGHYMIREQVPGGRVWTTRVGPNGETLEDFAIVSRLIDSKTGQFTVTVAGIGPKGTQAAGEFVSSARYLEEGLADAPSDWQKRNLEVLLQTTVIDSVAGPPHAIATFVW